MQLNVEESYRAELFRGIQNTTDGEKNKHGLMGQNERQNNVFSKKKKKKSNRQHTQQCEQVSIFNRCHFSDLTPAPQAKHGERLTDTIYQ